MPGVFSPRQRQILAEITRGLDLGNAWSAVEVEQSPGYVDSVVEVADFAAALMGAIGGTVAAIGERRGLGPDLMTPHTVPHRPTSIFRLGLARRRGSQTL